MNINYNVDHDFFKLPLFNSEKKEDKMTSLQRLVTFNLLCQIVNFTKYGKDKMCQVWLSQIAADFGCDRRYLTRAMKDLQRHGLIKIIKPYDRKTQQGAWVQSAISYSTTRPKLEHNTPKAGVQSTRVMHTNALQPKNDDSTNVSSSSSKWENTSTGPRRKMTREEQIALIEKTRERTARMQEEQQSQK